MEEAEFTSPIILGNEASELCDQSSKDQNNCEMKSWNYYKRSIKTLRGGIFTRNIFVFGLLSS